MNNIKELREKLTNIFHELESGKIDNKTAKEFTNVAGKIISSAKIEIDYAKLNRKGKTINFLEYE